MTKMNYNRPIHQKSDERHKEKTTLQKTLDYKPQIKSNKINFGKYKGFSIDAIPTGYLEWLVSITTDDQQALKYCRELAKRPKYNK